MSVIGNPLLAGGGGGGSAVGVTDTPDVHGGTIREITAVSLEHDTVAPGNLLQGVTAHDSTGQAITGTYVAPTERTASDVTVSGATVTVPAGAYATQVQKSVANGTAGTPTATKGTVSNHSVQVTPSVTNTTGYITGSTKTGTAVSVSASELVSGTKEITGAGTTDVTNYASASVAAGTAGTPTASKGSVSNHAVTVTPSVTNTAGYISGGTKAGTGVTVQASELVSGSQEITQNGTVDVTNLEEVVVNVSGGGSTSWKISLLEYDYDDEGIVFFSGSDVIGNIGAYIIYATGTISNPADRTAVAFVGDDNVNIAWYYNNGNAVESTGVAVRIQTSNQTVGVEIIGSSSPFIDTGASYCMLVVHGGSGAFAFRTTTYDPPSGVHAAEFSVDEMPPLYFCGLDASVALNQYHRVQTVVKSDDKNVFSGTNFYTGTLGYYADFTEAFSNGTLTITSSGNNAGGYFHNPETYTLFYALEEDLSGVPLQSKTITPTKSTQEATPDTGYVGLRKVTVNPIPSEYIVPSGSKDITSNGNGIDVAEYATVNVNVPSGGSTKAVYTYQGLASRTANSYGATSATVTVTKAGTYNISYVAIRGSSSGTMGTNLHIGANAGTNNQTFNNGTYGQYATLTNQQIAANTAVTIYATSGSNSRSIYVGQLIVEEV